MINQISTELKTMILMISLGFALMIISGLAKVYSHTQDKSAKIINLMHRASFVLILYSSIKTGSRIFFIVLKTRNWLISVAAWLGVTICPICLMYFALLIEGWIQRQDSEDPYLSPSNHQKGRKKKVNELIDRIMKM